MTASAERSAAAGALIANARMYSVAPGAAAAWKRLFAWLQERSGVDLQVIDHAFPAPLDALWARPDLACTFMCGWPYLRHGAVHQLVAAPIPRAAYARARPAYCSHLVVRAQAPYRRIEDTFGQRFGYTIPDSHSGYNAPRHHLLRFRGDAGKPLYREVVGPLMTPRLMLEAIAAGKVDVGPLDSFAFDLLSRHEPDLARQVRVIDSTQTVPMPGFVAAPGTAPVIVERLAAALFAFGADATQAALREDLCILGFARVTAQDYAVTAAWAQEARARGLETIA